MSRTPRLEESLARWESAPSTECSVELLEAATAALDTNGAAPAAPAPANEPRERELERLDAVPPLPVEADGEVGTAVEDPSQEAREDRARADLGE